jgi:hypothetical protein
MDDESKGSSLPRDKGGSIGFSAVESVEEAYDWVDGGLIEDPGDKSWFNIVETEEDPAAFWIHSGGSKSESKAEVEKKSGVIARYRKF